MPHWSNQPPADPRGNSLPLTRTPAAKQLRGIITSPDLLGCITHFWKGRTLPCESPHCEACTEGMPWRWHAYLGLFLPETRQHVLFECTAQVAEKLVTYRTAHGSLRGVGLLASRPSRRPNGRVAILRWTPDVDPDSLPDPPNIVAALAVIWNIPTAQLSVPETLRLQPKLCYNTTERMHQPHPQPVSGGNGDDQGRPPA
jgi:hypothetical protein